MEDHGIRRSKAFVAAAKAADPKWDFGKPIPAGALDGIKREDIEASMRSIDVGRILRTFKIKKNVEVTDNGKIII